ncbi:hypothetical protein UCMB321_4586 [Pseudomonas batumici]|uniref:Uncharacterized protein n=1 Tax=Pseudomonas batumici TaxID=226910 RepID=A0A0C2HX14_9PSED|nr:hypothetical protein UCMB321_4586 [Pseudomonas batumici]
MLPSLPRLIKQNVRHDFAYKKLKYCSDNQHQPKAESMK